MSSDVQSYALRRHPVLRRFRVEGGLGTWAGRRIPAPDVAHEETNHSREVVEAALAHQVKDKVEAAYARSTLFERRRRLMGDWTTYLDGTARVVEVGESLVRSTST